MTLDEFITKYNITMDAEYAENNPNMDGERTMNHYLVTLHHDKREYSLYFSQGLGIKHKPTAKSVLESVLLDVSCVESGQTFEDFCSELGYDTDSRRAERIYNACLKERDQIGELFGPEVYEEFTQINEG